MDEKWLIFKFLKIVIDLPLFRKFLDTEEKAEQVEHHHIRKKEMAVKP